MDSAQVSTESAQSPQSKKQGQLQSYSYSQWCPAVTQPMNLTRDLSDILNRVLHIENSILNRILLVRRMENQHVEADIVYVNRGDSSEFEYRDENPSPLPPLSQLKHQT